MSTVEEVGKYKLANPNLTFLPDDIECDWDGQDDCIRFWAGPDDDTEVEIQNLREGHCLWRKNSWRFILEDVSALTALFMIGALLYD